MDSLDFSSHSTIYLYQKVLEKEFKTQDRHSAPFWILFPEFPLDHGPIKRR